MMDRSIEVFVHFEDNTSNHSCIDPVKGGLSEQKISQLTTMSRDITPKMPNHQQVGRPLELDGALIGDEDAEHSRPLALRPLFPDLSGLEAEGCADEMLHSIISVTALSSEAVLKLRNRVRADSPLAS